MCCLCGCCECIVNTICAFLAFAVNSLIKLVIIVCTVSLIVCGHAPTQRRQVPSSWSRDHAIQLRSRNDEQQQNSITISQSISIRKSNSRLGIHYDRFEARVYYDHQRFAAASVPSFYQGHKSTVVVGTVFQGQNLVLLGGHGRRKFDDDLKSGVYGIDVELRLRARLMSGLVNTWRFKPRVRCRCVPLILSEGLAFNPPTATFISQIFHF